MVKFSLFFALIVILAVISSCSNNSELRKREISQERKLFLAKYEATFDPSLYAEVNFPDTIPVQKAESTFVETVPPEQMFQGFRVQVYISEDIDSAKLFQQAINLKLEKPWVYLIFDAPLYKVRVGDFNNRVDATDMMNMLIQLGYTKTWIVPDKVRKDPPPKPIISLVQPDSLNPIDTIQH